MLNAGAQSKSTPPVGHPGISAISPGGLDFAPERSSDALLPFLFSSLLSVRVFSALFPPLGPFGHQFQLILGGLGPRKHSNFIKRIIKFNLFAIFASDAAWGHENHPTTSQMRPPGTPKATPEEPRSAQERPRRAPSRPDTSGEPFGSPCWPHPGAPGASFSSLLGVLFEPRARSARQTKALFEITGQKVFRDRCGPDVQRPLST